MAGVSRGTLDRIAKLVARAYPDEGCGWVRRSGAVEPVVNAAAAPRRAYAFSLADLMRFEDAFATQDPPVAVYHSHPDGPPRLSARDLEEALFDGEPLYPVRQIVVEVAGGRPRRFAEFRFQAAIYATSQAGVLGEGGA